MADEILTHLMFDGAAEEAMRFYVSLFPSSQVVVAQRFEEGESQGKLVYGRFEINGHSFSCADSPVKHDFSFTPSASLFVECESLEELETLFSRLSQDGVVLMPLDDYGFSTRFGWLNDRFGVSWQLNLV